MSSEFDPYYTWLGIPPEERPANHYRLLGVRFLEDVPDVILNAADRQMAHLRTFQGGPHSGLSQKLLNEVAAAKVCLLNPQRKAEYDAQLLAVLNRPPAATRPVTPPAAPPMRKSDPEPDSALRHLFEKVHEETPARAAQSHSMPVVADAKGMSKVWITTGSAIAGVVLLAGLMVAYLTSGDTPQEPPPVEQSRLVLIWPESARAGARLGIDGRAYDLKRDPAKTTADRIELALDQGKHTLRIVHKDAPPFEKSLTLAEGNRLEIEVPNDSDRPQSGVGKLILLWPEAERAGVVLQIDGKAIDLARMADDSSLTDVPVELQSGKHVLRIERAGFKPFERAVDVQPHAVQKLAVTWTPLPPESDGRGLQAELFQDGALKNLIKIRYDRQVNFNWLEGSPDVDLYKDEFSIRWTGWIKAPMPGKYRIVSIHDDSVRVYLDDRRIINDWGGHFPESRSAECEFDDQPHALKIEYREGPQVAAISFRWVYPGGAIAWPVPPECLFCDEDLARQTKIDIRIPTPQEEDPEQTPVCGLKAELFAGENFDRLITTRIDPLLDFLWGVHSPAKGVPSDKFSIRWTGWLVPPRAGRYHLVMTCDTGGRVKIGERTVVDGWGKPDRYEADVDLTAEAQPIVIEHREHYTNAAFSLHWVPPGEEMAVPIPPWCLRPASVEKKSSLPDEATQREQVAEISEELKIEEARTTRSQIAVARQLLEAAKKTTDDPARQYALLLLTMQTSYKVRDVSLMMEAIDEASRQFEGYDALGKKFSGLSGLAGKVGNSVDAGALLKVLPPLIDELLLADRYPDALQAAEAAYKVAIKSVNAEARKALFDRHAQLKGAAEFWQQYQKALVTLQTSPDDAEANDIAGRWRCMVCSDWDGGLPRLAKGANESLAKLARLDLAGPTRAGHCMQLAERWQGLAASAAGELAAYRGAIQDRARYWYSRALEDGYLSVDDAMRAVHRVQETLGDTTPPPSNLLAGRLSPYRPALAQAGGASDGSERAVAMALKWLAAHQLPDGGWSFDHGVAPGCRGLCPNGGEMTKARNAATGMALLPFLGAGQTHAHGKYKATVRRGLEYLCRSITPNKSGGSFHEADGTMYSHALATTALCEAYALTKDADLRLPAQNAVNYVAYAQDPVGGGWRYSPRQAGDMSVTGWQCVALRTANVAGLQVPRISETLAKRFLDSVQTDAGASYGYTSPGDGASTSAIGLTCRALIGCSHDYPALVRGVDKISDYGVSSTNIYYDYYATQLMRHYGGETWKKWNQPMRDMLVTRQSQEGHTAGSWYFGTDKVAECAGRLGVTSMATLILEVYYRHLPVFPETRKEGTDGSDTFEAK